MQLEDKLVDGREAAHVESQQREDVLEHGEDALPAPMVEAMHAAAVERRGQLLGAIRMILDRQSLVVSQLHLPQRESRALDALQVAVTGQSHDLGTFVYASDRRDLLEQALAVLQPDITHVDDQHARELHAQFADLAERVGDLRHALTDLEDAQDELLESHPKAALEQGATDPNDKPKPRPSDPDAPRPPSTLTDPQGPGGPELPPAPSPPSTLTGGPELPPAPSPPSTLTGGPELPPAPSLPSTLTGPELPPAPSLPSTLTSPGGPELPPAPSLPSTLTGPGGPELPPEAKPASELGVADDVADDVANDVAGDVAAKAKRPWWRRPFG